MCVCVCVCVQAYVAVKDAFSIVKISLFSMNISGLYIRYAWDLYNSWRFKFLCVYLESFFDCMGVCVSVTP